MNRMLVNKKIIASLMSIVIYASMCFQGVIKPYNILSFLIVFILYLAIINTNLNNS